MIQPYIQLDGKSYLLLRKQAGGPRTWEEITLPAPSMEYQRSDIFQGQSDRRTVSWNDWSGGVAGLYDDVPNTLYMTQNAHGLIPGQLRPVSDPSTTSHTESHAASLDHSWAGVYNGDLFTIVGLYVYKWANGTVTLDKTLAAAATDAIVFNDTLIVAVAGANNIALRDNAGSWTLAADAVYSDFFANVEGRLWRCTNTNEVSNIGPTDAPGTLVNWSTGIAVGDDDIAITDLNAYGERLAVSKTNGLFLGDAEALFPNVLPQLEDFPDGRNGVNTLVNGASIYYPHSRGVIHYALGNVDEIGLDRLVQSVANQDTGDIPQGTQIRCMAVEGEYIWGATETSGQQRRSLLGFKKTTDAGGSYTSYLTEVTDKLATTGAALGSLDTLANGDWFVVGYTTAFYGVEFELSNPNTTATPALTVQFWNGSAWTAFDNAAAVTDFTTLPSHASASTTYNGTLRRSGKILWRNSGLGTWASSTIDGTAAFWVRFTVSSALDSTVTVSECRVVSNTPGVYVYRGRVPTSQDARGGSMIWEPYGYISGMISPTSMVVTHDMYPHWRKDQIAVVGRNVTSFIKLSPNDWEGEPFGASTASYAEFPLHDGGMPFVWKHWTAINVRMTSPSNETITIKYRVDEGHPWASTLTFSTKGSAYINVEGVALQLQVSFNSLTPYWYGPPILLAVEATFRPMPARHRQWKQYVVLADDQALPNGGMLANAKTQLTALEALTTGSVPTPAAQTVSYRDPFQREIGSVIVHPIKIVELAQFESEKPQAIVEITVEEVVTS